MAQSLKPSVTGFEQGVSGIHSAGAELPRPVPNPDQIMAEEVNLPPDHRIVFYSSPCTPASDRIRYLRMQLRNMREARGLKTVLIASATARDGKSTLALNLATALAEEGKNRVLLLEADLHHAPLAGRLGLSTPNEGLVRCLQTGADPFSVIRRLNPLGWYLLPAGQPPTNPTELLQTNNFGTVLKHVSGSFDWILIDSPPVVPLSDAVFLRQHADATLLVVRAGHTPQTAVDEAVRQLGRQNIAAMVLNAVEGLERIYHKYGSTYYASAKASKRVSD